MRKYPIQGGVDLIASQQTILPTSCWIDIQHLSCIFYLLSSLPVVGDTESSLRGNWINRFRKGFANSQSVRVQPYDIFFVLSGYGISFDFVPLDEINAPDRRQKSMYF